MSLFLFINLAFAQDPQAQLQNAGNDPVVQSALQEPDGVGLDFSDPSNWKMYALGTASYDFNDAEERTDACKVAALKAKGNMSKFLKETVSTADSYDKVVAKAKKQTKDSKSVGKLTIETSIESIRSNSDAILAGVITLETNWEWQGDAGLCQVKLGQSQKTLNMAQNIRGSIQDSMKSPQNSAQPNSTTNQGSGGSGSQKAKTDF